MKTNITPEEYSSILKTFELEDIALSEGSFKVNDCSKNGGTINLNFKDKYTYSDIGNKVIFHASFKLNGAMDDTNETLFKMSGDFKITNSKDKEVVITEDFFNVYKEVSLTFLIWPYFREYIQNTLLKAGIPPLILPMRIFLNKK